jgi:hypothetical protein
MSVLGHSIFETHVNVWNNKPTRQYIKDTQSAQTGQFSSNYGIIEDEYCDMIYLSVPVIVKPALIHSNARHVIRVDVIHTLRLDDWSAVT